ncbi:hypothetical protein RF55_12433 [Lasius niger]|uniref:Uncharacterized protein n=1 Tax=Lasius niger TaxID=67767 RepID=A0A0J7KD73_LASNI|nr:hypothetical protein RF55_12433 [Lasius niger]
MAPNRIPYQDLILIKDNLLRALLQPDSISARALAQRTIFDWILSGPVRTEEERKDTMAQCTVGSPLSTFVRRFWEQEGLPLPPSSLTKEDQE